MNLLVDHRLSKQKHHLILTLDENDYEKLQYIADRTQWSIEHVVKWALDEYFTIVFVEEEEDN
jgi:hypothetical protein